MNEDKPPAIIYTISVIIPVKNGATTLGKCLASIAKQTIAGHIEIVILDSQSTDDSVQIAHDFGARVVAIEPAAFNHGFTRNAGVDNASGQLLFFTVQDAYLAEDNQLEIMAAYFNDITVQGVVGMQAVPHDHDKNPIKWFKRFNIPVAEIRHFPAAGSFGNMSKNEQFKLSNWDNVNAMYRKTALTSIPFIKTNLSEDWLWANAALHAGMKLVRDSSLVVYHYHHMYFSYVFRSAFTLSYHFYIFFNKVPGINFSPVSFFKLAYGILKMKSISFYKKIYWIAHNLSAGLAVFLSVLTFRVAFLFGKRKLIDSVYNFLCKEIPQGSQKIA